MDIFGTIINLLFFVLMIYLISRVAHFMNNTKIRLDEIERKLDEILKSSSNKEN
ncbi:tetrahydromethanopterin S-methyltransferase subunit G [Metabacillus malikii]|uniref:Tetrahydromethanopterin S-methyltransferase subunit G n=1 Tax=Metabacillus malikii TaxID=1504265 RepID=A0ABT9ZA16_9BACI|nr:tetrahydromethanopterin S-methyltransferase subunit G [Metabacillus malikii]